MSAATTTRINHLRYRERFNLSYQQFLDEPVEEIEFAFTVWALEHERDKLNTARQQAS